MAAGSAPPLMQDGRWPRPLDANTLACKAGPHAVSSDCSTGCTAAEIHLGCSTPAQAHGLFCAERPRRRVLGARTSASSGLLGIVPVKPALLGPSVPTHPHSTRSPGAHAIRHHRSPQRHKRAAAAASNRPPKLPRLACVQASWKHLLLQRPAAPGLEAPAPHTRQPLAATRTQGQRPGSIRLASRRRPLPTSTTAQAPQRFTPYATNPARRRSGYVTSRALQRTAGAGRSGSLCLPCYLALLCTWRESIVTNATKALAPATRPGDAESDAAMMLKPPRAPRHCWRVHTR